MRGLGRFGWGCFVAVLIAACLAVAPGRAIAHTPHDVITAVVPSPTFDTDHTVFVVSRGTLMRSTDGGQNWQEIVAGIIRPEIDALAAAPTDASKLYIVLNGAVFRSLDTGSTWTPTGFGSRSDIANVVVSRTNANIVFAASSSSGLFRSINGGQSWTSVGSFGSVAALLSPAAGRIVVGSSSGAISTSSDDGAHWSNASGAPRGQQITALSTPPGMTSPVFAGTSAGHLYRSMDDGHTFSALGSGLPNEHITGLATSSHYASTATVWAATTHSVYRSTNGGSTFVRSAAGLTTDPQAQEWGVPDFEGVVAAPTASSDVLFAAGFDGLFRSDDLATSWSELQTQSEQITGFAVSPNFAQDRTVVASTYVKGAYISHDAGGTWTPIDVGLGSKDPGNNKFAPLWREHDVVFSPDFVHDHTLFLATINDLRRSTDGGASWDMMNVEPIESGDANHSRYVIAVSPNYATDHTVFLGSFTGHLLRSTSSGDSGSWTRIGTVPYRVRSIMVSPAFATDHTVFISTLNGVYRSTDAGASWQRSGGTFDQPILAMSPAFPTDHTLFAGTWRGLFVTHDGGHSWTAHTAAPLPTSVRVDVVAVSPTFASDHLVLASVFGRGLYRSTDNGVTFSPSSPELLANNIIIADYDNPTSLPIVFSPSYASDHTVYGWFASVIVRSTDGGVHWTILQLPPGASILQPPSIVEAPAAPSVLEGGSGTTTTMEIPVDLTHPSKETITVKWHTVDGTTPGVASSKSGDFVAASGTLTYTYGVSEQDIPVTINGDATVEPNETVIVQLADATNATLSGNGQVTGIIVNDDGSKVNSR
jgi:photosystem II stability/assembly factor-like uncharacterized protein